MSALKYVLIGCTLLLAATSANAGGFARVGTSFGAWEDLTTSAKLSALGGGDLADDGPSTLLVNPAPLGTGSGAEFSYDHGNYIAETEFNTYAAAVEISNFRLNYVQQSFSADDQLVRTAFNPEGTGETFSFREAMSLLGLSYDLNQVIGEDSPFSWSLGVAWRRYTGDFDGTKGEGDTIDLGTTLRWVSQHAQGWTGLTVAASRKNLTNENYTMDSREFILSRSHRLGVTFEAALRKPDHADDRLKLLVAYARNSPVGGSFRERTDHYGFEVLFKGFLAARYGHNTTVSDGVSSWGAGVVLNREWLGPLTIELDWGVMSYNHAAIDEDQTLWGLRAHYKF